MWLILSRFVCGDCVLLDAKMKAKLATLKSEFATNARAKFAASNLHSKFEQRTCGEQMRKSSQFASRKSNATRNAAKFSARNNKSATNFARAKPELRNVEKRFLLCRCLDFREEKQLAYRFCSCFAANFASCVVQSRAENEPRREKRLLLAKANKSKLFSLCCAICGVCLLRGRFAFGTSQESALNSLFVALCFAAESLPFAKTNFKLGALLARFSVLQTALAFALRLLASRGNAERKSQKLRLFLQQFASSEVPLFKRQIKAEPKTTFHFESSFSAAVRLLHFSRDLPSSLLRSSCSANCNLATSFGNICRCFRRQKLELFRVLRSLVGRQSAQFAASLTCRKCQTRVYFCFKVRISLVAQHSRDSSASKQPKLVVATLIESRIEFSRKLGAETKSKLSCFFLDASSAFVSTLIQR